jgi:hypothetical protein
MNERSAADDGRDEERKELILMATETFASIEVYFLKFNMTGSEGPVHAFLYNPSIVATLTSAPSGTSYSVAFNLTSNIPNTRFVRGDSITGTIPPPDLQWTRSNDDTTITATFTNTGLTATDPYGFELTVDANGTEFTSDDPEIEVPPPNG